MNKQKLFRSLRHVHAIYATALIWLFNVVPAHASTGDLPWETTLDRIVQSFVGPVTRGVLILAIIALGFAVMWSDGPMLRKSFGVLLGGAIAAAATSIALEVFGVVQGATF